MWYPRSRLLFVETLLTCFLLSGSATAADRTRVHLLRNIHVADFGSEQLRIGDLSGDGGPDLLLVQSKFATREITCLTALTIDGEVLWQSGTPSLDNGRIYSDLPVQIYDWDDDGANDVLYVRQARYLEPWTDPAQLFKSTRERAAKYEGSAMLVVLDGRTGEPKSELALPAGADDCFLIANLTGSDRPQDLVVKDRYWNAWGIAHDGRELWHFTGSTGHFPSVYDVDGDGRDETFFGYTLVGPEGKVLFSHDPNRDWQARYVSLPPDPSRQEYARFLATPLHSDAQYIVRLADGQLRLLFGNTGLHCLTSEGRVLWEDDRIGEAQHVVAGKFRQDSEYQVVVFDRTPNRELRKSKPDEAFGNLYLYDLAGNMLWKQQQPPGEWLVGCTSLNWFGREQPQSILVYGYRHGRPVLLLDGKGHVRAEFPLNYLPDRRAEEPEAWQDPMGVCNQYPLCADVWGDSRDEVILFGARGLSIYTNAAPAAEGSLYNETLYPGT